MNAAESAELYSEVARKYVEDGLSAQAIARGMQLSERQVLKHLRASGVYDAGRDARIKRERAAEAYQLQQEGLTLEEIATRLGFDTRSGAYRAIESHKQRENGNAEADEGGS